MGPRSTCVCWQWCVWLPFDLRWLFIKSVFVIERLAQTIFNFYPIKISLTYQCSLAIGLWLFIDTGAQVPLIDEQYCKFFSSNKSSPEVKFSNKTVQAIECNGTQLQINGTIIGKFQFHQYHNSPLFAEFYTLKKCSQQCIFPFTWLKALKVII